jgi:CubicO group peptidase (beta-lactamase class C family)
MNRRTPARHHRKWIAAFGTLPLLGQPGERFRDNTGAMVAGVLIERVAGAPFAEVLTQRMMTSPEPPAVVRDFWSAAYAAFA